MSATFTPVTEPEQIARLAALAEEIWRQHFTPILKEGQVDYMLDKFQSEHAMKKQMAEDGYRYFFIENESGPVGYTGIKKDGEKLFLSKLYLQQAHRGKGYASCAFAFLEGICREENLSAIWLTVNRYNYDTIEVYKKKGFLVIREQVADIGNGYVMDDYVMEKPIGGAEYAV